ILGVVAEYLQANASVVATTSYCLARKTAPQAKAMAYLVVDDQRVVAGGNQHFLREQLRHFFRRQGRMKIKQPEVDFWMLVGGHPSEAPKGRLAGPLQSAACEVLHGARGDQPEAAGSPLQRMQQGGRDTTAILHPIAWLFFLGKCTRQVQDLGRFRALLS